MTKSRKIASPVNARAGVTEINAELSHPITSEQCHHYVQVAAYYIAERRGFDEGSCEDDWAQAELEIDRLLAEGKFNH
ncbi:MAG: DUF2934 domain-containing protein [Sideroxydans sp.]|nr:DUF2934 domain-containing protein [Sideroxydans sp.]